MKTTILTILVIALMTQITHAQDSTKSIFLNIGGAFGEGRNSYSLNYTALNSYGKRAQWGIVAGISFLDFEPSAGNGSALVTDFGLSHKLILGQEDGLALGLYQNITLRLPVSFTVRNDSSNTLETISGDISTLTGNIEVGFWTGALNGLQLRFFLSTQTLGGPLEVVGPFNLAGFRIGMKL